MYRKLKMTMIHSPEVTNWVHTSSDIEGGYIFRPKCRKIFPSNFRIIATYFKQRFQLSEEKTLITYHFHFEEFSQHSPELFHLKSLLV